MNDPSESLSSRPARRFWGWGAADDVLDAAEQARLRFVVEQLGGQFSALHPPEVAEFNLRAPRVAAPPALSSMISATPHDRLSHAFGKSYADCARMWLRSTPNPPDWVAFANDEQGVIDILDWAAQSNVAVIPFGGGTSVCGGVEPAVPSFRIDTFHRLLRGSPLRASIGAVRIDSKQLPSARSHETDFFGYW